MNSNLAFHENALKIQDFQNKKRGLTDSEVRKSRNKYGENRISRKKKKGFLLSFLESFGDPMIKILLIALVINVIFLMHQSSWFETIGIAIAILLATFVSTLSEYGSESAFEKLQEEAACIECKVQRAKGLKQIPIQEIVVGDIVLLQAGDRIPADGVMIYGSLEVNQSSLNGESKEVSKYPQTFAITSESEKDDFFNPQMLYSGTIVCAGEGLMQVTAIGDHTYYGRIGAAIQEETRESPLRIRLRDLAASIGRLGYVAAIFSVCAYFFNTIILDNNFNVADILKTCTTWSIMFPHLLKACTLAVTVIVMAVPEGLPMMITVVLSANMKRMLKDNVLVRKLVGIETAGSLNILFTDKTGTLTQGKLQVTHFITGDCSVWNKQEAGQNQNNIWGILCDAIQYNCAASLNQGIAIGGNATDRALLEFAANLKSRHKNLEKVKVIPFTSDLKYMATSITGGWNVTLIKGAPEKILPFCTKYYHESGAILPFTGKTALDKISNEFAKKAVRLVAVAVSDNPTNVTIQSMSRFENLTLVGLLGIRDEIRPDAIHGIREVQSAGILTVMITGDSAPTAHAIAIEIGLIQSSRDLVITSTELRTMSDSILRNKLPDIRVVARALPSDKSRLVTIAQEMGLVVGMTGDGVNDAPALKQADIGFAMGSGTEVAKEAGDIVILDDNIRSISNAVCYGRTIFKSIRKFIIYQLSICMCAVGVTIIGPLIRVDSPITVIQMLWINIVMDTLAGLAFSGEKARKSYMKEPPKSRDEKIINPYMMQQITVNSLYSTGLCLFFLKSATIQNMFGFENNAYKMTAFFSLFMYSAIFTSFTARTHQLNLFDYLSANKPFLLIMGFVTVVQTMIIYYGGTVFRTVQLGFHDLILVALLSFTVIPVDFLRKYLLHRHSDLIGT
jgi:calcium-translocating P-type ATPase